MIKIFSFTLALVILVAGLVFAHPPKDMQLKYDETSQTLHIEMVHVTSDMFRNYVYRIVVLKNEEQVINQFFTKQKNPHDAIEDFSLQAVVGDVIRVKAFCKEGGEAEETLTILKPENTESPKDK